MTRNVLVVGGAGFIGSTTAHHLVRAGYRPVILDDFSRGHRCFIADFTVYEANVGDVAAVRGVLERESIEVVLHFAARIEVSESVVWPLQMYRPNVAGTIGLLEAMEEAGVDKLVFSSSAAVYGAAGQGPIIESHPRAPINPYGHSKAMMEQIIADCGAAPAGPGREPLSWVALRYFNAAGADIDLACGEWHRPESHLIPCTLRAAAGVSSELSVFGTDHPTADGSAVRDYIHVIDLAAAHIAAVDKLVAEPRVGRAYNLGAGVGYSVREVIAMVEQVTGRPVPRRELPVRPGDPPALVAAIDAARAELGWSPRRSKLETIVGDAWEWFNAHGFEPPA